MIVREREREFVMITQHDHALLAGWFAALWGNSRVAPPPEPKGPLCLAAALHDVGWIALDRRPEWNEEENRPYTFYDLPHLTKLPGRRAGVDRVEQEDAYAALLCSLHYPGLFPDYMHEQPEVVAFTTAEEERQARLAAALRAAGRAQELERVDHDLQLLRLWDEMSLFVAMNEPGVGKGDDHPWFRDGFKPVVPAPDGSGPIRFHARWLDVRHVAFDPFPLRDSLAYPLHYRLVEKVAVDRVGFPTAYQEASQCMQVIEFVPEP